MYNISHPNILICDLGDVIFHWQPSKDSLLNPQDLYRVIHTKAWHALERGEVTETQCIDQAATELNLSQSAIEDAIRKAEVTAGPNERLLSEIKCLKATSEGRLKVYAMSNISHEHFAYIRALPWDWDVFDHIFTSAAAGMRKPDSAFYAHVLKNIMTEHFPFRAVFIDDKVSNVEAAIEAGMQAFVHDPTDTERTLLRLRGVFGHVSQASKPLTVVFEEPKTAATAVTIQEVFEEDDIMAPFW